MSEDVQTRIILRKAVDKIVAAALQKSTPQTKEAFMAACMEHGKSEEECKRSWEEQQRQTETSEEKAAAKSQHTIDQLFRSYKFDEAKEIIEPEDRDPLSKAICEKRKEGRL